MPKYPLPSDESDQRPGLKAPQFGLASFMWLIALVALTAFTVREFGPLLGAVVVLAMFAIAAHVLGNALGTRLRDQASADDEGKNETGHVKIAESHHFAPTTKLSLRQKQLSRPLMIMIASGTILAAVLGGALLYRLNADRMTIGHLVLAAVSSGVLGGLGGFATFTFFRVFLEAWRQAHQDS